MSHAAPIETVQVGRSVKMLIAALFVGTISLVFLSGVFLGLYSLVYDRDSFIIMPIIILISGPIGLWLLCAAAISLGDFFRKYPILTIDRESIHDRRLSDKGLRLGDIEHAKVLYTRGGPVGVRLRLRTDAAFRNHPCRIGCWVMLRRRDSRDVCISTTLLSWNPRKLTAVIADHIERAGATVDRKSLIANYLQPDSKDNIY